MNSVYYIFLVIIVLSFITGIIITIIDNRRGEPFENEVPVKKNIISIKDVPVRSNSLGDTLQGAPVMEAVTNTQSTVPYLPIDASQMIPALVLENPPIVNDNKIQIAQSDEKEYYSVPVLIPMDDDII